MPPETPAMATDAASRAMHRGAVMAFDFGKRRIGVAVGDRELGIAHPLETLHYNDAQDPLNPIETLVGEWQPVLFVVGMPMNTDGTEHTLAPSVLRFSAALTSRFGVATRLVDERFTSAEASGMLRDAGIRGRRQKAYLDQVAAQTILEDFFSNDEAVS
jgi:putative pre-16S rRNA nuclease